MDGIEKVTINGIEIIHSIDRCFLCITEIDDSEQVMIRDTETIEKLYEFLKRRLGK